MADGKVSTPQKGARHLGTKELRALSAVEDPNSPSLWVFLMLEGLEWALVLFFVWLLMSFLGSLIS